MAYVPPHLRGAATATDHHMHGQHNKPLGTQYKGPRPPAQPRPTHFISLPCAGDAHTIVRQAQQFIVEADRNLFDFCEAAPVLRSHVSLLMLRLTDEGMVKRAIEVFMLFKIESAATPSSVNLSGLDNFHNGGILYLTFTQESVGAIVSLREALRLHFISRFPEAIFLDARQKGGDLSFTPHLTLAKKPWEDRGPKWGGAKSKVPIRAVPSGIVSDLSSKVVDWVSLGNEVKIDEIHLCVMGSDKVGDKDYYHIEALLPLAMNAS